MAAYLMPRGKHLSLDDAGAPLAGGKLYTYAAGTSTPLSTYSDQAGTVPNTNPVVLDARGEATIFWGTGPYKLVLTTSADVEIWTQDNLYPSAAAADLAALEAALAAPLGGAPFLAVSGAVGAPGYAFVADPTSGLYLSSGAVRMAIGGAEVFRALSTGVVITGLLTISNGAAVTGAVSATTKVITDSAGAGDGTLSYGLQLGGAASGCGVVSKRTAGGNQNGLDFMTAGVSRLAIDSSGAFSGLPTPAVASAPATKDYVDARFVVAASFGTTGTLLDQTGTLTLGDASHPSTGRYTVAIAGLTTSSIVLATANLNANTAYANRAAGSLTVLTHDLTSALIDAEFSILVVKL